MLARWQAAIVDDKGNALSGASVTVRREAAGAPLASIFADRDGTAPLGNPFINQTPGQAFFHVAGGAYRIDVTKDANVQTWRYVGVGLNAELDGGISGPGAGTAAGQLAAFTDNTGSALAGLVLGQPPAPVTLDTLLTIIPDEVSDAEVRGSNGVKYISPQRLATAAAGVALADAASVALNWDSGIFFTLTCSQNFTLANPVNGKPGQFRHIHIRGNSTTDRTVSFGNQFFGELPTIIDLDSAKQYLLIVACLATNHFTVSAKVCRT